MQHIHMHTHTYTGNVESMLPFLGTLLLLPLPLPSISAGLGASVATVPSRPTVSAAVLVVVDLVLGGLVDSSTIGSSSGGYISRSACNVDGITSITPASAIVWFAAASRLVV